MNFSNQEVLRLLPPLIIGKKEIDLFVNKFQKILNWKQINK